MHVLPDLEALSRPHPQSPSINLGDDAQSTKCMKDLPQILRSTAVNGDVRVGHSGKPDKAPDLEIVRSDGVGRSVQLSCTGHPQGVGADPADFAAHGDQHPDGLGEKSFILRDTYVFEVVLGAHDQEKGPKVEPQEPNF